MAPSVRYRVTVVFISIEVFQSTKLEWLDWIHILYNIAFSLVFTYKFKINSRLGAVPWVGLTLSQNHIQYAEYQNTKVSIESHREWCLPNSLRWDPSASLVRPTKLAQLDLFTSFWRSFSTFSVYIGCSRSQVSIHGCLNPSAILSQWARSSRPQEI